MKSTPAPPAQMTREDIGGHIIQRHARGVNPEQKPFPSSHPLLLLLQSAQRPFSSRGRPQVPPPFSPSAKPRAASDFPPLVDVRGHCVIAVRDIADYDAPLSSAARRVRERERLERGAAVLPLSLSFLSILGARNSTSNRDRRAYTSQAQLNQLNVHVAMLLVSLKQHTGR